MTDPEMIALARQIFYIALEECYKVKMQCSDNKEREAVDKCMSAIAKESRDRLDDPPNEKIL